MIRRHIFFVFVMALLVGCASTSGTGSNTNPKDPWEGMNRKIMGFNDTVDDYVLKPVAKGYQAVVPSVVRTGVSNFFSNLGDLWSALNHTLQGEIKRAGQTVGRFTLNTFLGLGGFIDIATDAGITPPKADFGQTLGRWGVPNGPYMVLPILGPSSVRDTAGSLADLSANPLNQVHDVGARDKMTALRIVDLRTQYLNATDTMDAIALDRYVFLRDAYLQRRSKMLVPSTVEASASPKDDKPPVEERFDIEEERPAVEAAAPKTTEKPN